jgi:class 3 adenylate cyclase/tetratricopeptide (TPR) repeat protein
LRVSAEVRAGPRASPGGFTIASACATFYARRVTICAKCGQENPDGARFCNSCAAPLAEKVASPLEERKIVTVVFCDLVGSTARAERLDPEDVRALLSRYHERVRSDLVRHGGTVEKFIGDAVMALFGAPLAHEDDPERAVRAALAVRDWARDERELEVRIGITTGEALVQFGARPEAGEGMASGDVVNTASRLQAAAPTNGILVDETTYRATQHAIDYGEAGPVEAKGKAEPVPVWEPIQARSRLEIDVRRPRAPLVGRDRELDLLVDALARVRAESSPQLLTLVGEPGIGKSRLIYELFQRIGVDPELIRWRQGRSLPYGEGVSFWALGEMVKAEAGILESDSPDVVQEKLRGAVAGLKEAEWLLTHLRPLVGLGAETELGADRKSEAFAAWRRFFEELAEQRPLVLVFEDLHWADEGLLDFVDHLAEWASGVPMLVVGSARPELLDRRPGWGGGKRNATTISLSGLGEADTARLLADLLEEPILDAETREMLLRRAAGNPLYAEEFARMLTERGVTEDLPETLQGVIAARLDVLDRDHKALLQRAAVVGKVFWLGALAAMEDASRVELEQGLHALERKEFIRRERDSTIEGDIAHAFLHVLVRDVAYGQIPRKERVELHRRAAAWLASLGRPEDHAEMLAHHYLQALELAQAAGLDTTDLVEPARRALANAGDRAASLYAVQAAERYYVAALRLTPEGDPEQPGLLFRRALPAGLHAGGGDPVLLAEARDALLSSGERAKAAEAEIVLSQTFRIRGRKDLADEHAARAVEMLADAPPTQSSAYVRAGVASRALVASEYDQAVELGSQALSEAERLGWSEGMADALSTIGAARAQTGDAEAGVRDLERAVELAAGAAALGALSRAYNNLSVVYQVAGDINAAYAARLDAERVAERLGSPAQKTWFDGVVCDHCYRAGDWAEASRRADDVAAAVEAGSSHYIASQAYTVRALLRLARDDPSGALADVEKAEAAARAIGDPQIIGFHLTASPYVLHVAERAERAAELVREFLDRARRGVPIGFWVINLPLLASAALLIGLGRELSDALTAFPKTLWSEVADAYVAGEFVRAAELLSRIGAKPDEAHARLQASKKFAAEGRPTEAEAQLHQALSFYRSIGATRYIREAEELLAATG